MQLQKTWGLRFYTFSVTSSSKGRTCRQFFHYIYGEWENFSVKELRPGQETSQFLFCLSKLKAFLSWYLISLRASNILEQHIPPIKDLSSIYLGPWPSRPIPNICRAWDKATSAGTCAIGLNTYVQVKIPANKLLNKNIFSAYLDKYIIKITWKTKCEWRILGHGSVGHWIWQHSVSRSLVQPIAIISPFSAHPNSIPHHKGLSAHPSSVCTSCRPLPATTQA